MENYEFNLVGAETSEFIWNDFCSSYIEFSKFTSDNESTKSTLCYVLTAIMKLLHPFMPFVTEEIYSMLPIKDSDSIMISTYPEYDSNLVFKKETAKFQLSILEVFAKLIIYGACTIIFLIFILLSFINKIASLVRSGSILDLIVLWGAPV